MSPPPHSNTGVRFSAYTFLEASTMKKSAFESFLFEDNYFVGITKFDWFAAGVESPVVSFVDSIKTHFRADVEHVVPRNGYRYAVRIVRGVHVYATVMYGGDNVGSRLHVSASGFESNELRDFLVLHYPDSILLRADVCLDIDEPEVFDSLFKVFCNISSDFRLNTNSVGDWVNNIKGRTFYIGSRQSPAFGRMYEKGKQLLSGSPDHVRVEIECKPKNTDSRAHWFSKPAAEFFSFNSWTSALFSAISSLNIDPSSVKPGVVHRESSHDRAMHFLIKQYRQTLKNELSFNGGDYFLLINRLIGSENE